MVGTVELLTLLILVILSATVWRRSDYSRWSWAVTICFAIAALVTPADVFSMLLVGAVFLGFYVAGTRHYSRRLEATVSSR